MHIILLYHSEYILYQEIKMKSYRKVLEINYPKRRGYINITPEVQKCLTESGIKEGLVLCKCYEYNSKRIYQ